MPEPDTSAFDNMVNAQRAWLQRSQAWALDNLASATEFFALWAQAAVETTRLWQQPAEHLQARANEVLAAGLQAGRAQGPAAGANAAPSSAVEVTHASLASRENSSAA